MAVELPPHRIEDLDKDERVSPDDVPEDLISRYYTEYYSLGMKETKLIDYTGLDQYAQKHSNGLVVVGLAPSHPILKNKQRVEEVRWELKAKKNKVHGRKKKGGLRCEKHTQIATLVCANGSEFPVRAGLCGSLIEMNHQLNKNPNLCTEKPRYEGFICIIQMSKKQKEKFENLGLQSRDAYLRMTRKSERFDH